MAKITELKDAPDWLKRARVRGEDVELVDGLVTWKGGIWESGIWEDGVWESGVWRNGIWERGIWERGVWESGSWMGGIWKDGFWKDGTWEGGVWENGTWENGTWEDGLWEGGCQNPVRCRWRVLITPDYRVKVGCKVKTVEEWEAWLESDAEFETPRSSPEFRNIHRALVSAMAAARFDLQHRADVPTGP